MSISKYRPSKKEMELIEELDIKVGDLFIDTRNDIIRIGEIKSTKEGVIIETEHQWDNEEWHSYGTNTVEEFKGREYVKLDKPIEEKEKEVLEKLANREFLEEQEELTEDTTALATTRSKEDLLGTKKGLESKLNEIEVMRRVLSRVTDELHGIVTAYQEKIEYVSKVIGVVELYLGVHEEIVQIREGERADVSVPVYIRQMLLFMDEEIAIIGADQQGMDFEQIELFDKWVSEEDHLNKILPEKKGVVALRVRREDKDYGDPYYNVEYNALNKMTYLLIRNGDNLYRIWSNLNIYPRMFPTKAELIEQTKDEDDIGFFDRGRVKDNTFSYKKHGLLLQGLLERTTILYPLHHKPDIFNPDTHDKVLVFIHDDECLLPSGRLDNPQRFFYNPGDEVYVGYDDYNYDYIGYKPRKNRIGFGYYSDEVLSYDCFDLEDVEFYLNCRTERCHYLEMIPLLQEVKKWKLEEIEKEKEFVKLVVGRNKTTPEKVLEAIQWWKLKNKWKRGVDSDDAKALRMIERKIKRDQILEKKND